MTVGYRDVRWALAVTLFAIACAPASGQRASPVAAAEALLAAFNDHDADGMAELVTDDFELYYMGEDGTAALAVTGPEALRAEMTSYFTAQPGVRSEFRGVIDGARFVAFREHIVGGASSLVVYEIADGRVRRAWYYPEEPGA